MPHFFKPRQRAAGVLSCFIFLSLCWGLIDAGAEPYFPKQPLRILSTYDNGGLVAPSPEHTWVVTAEGKQGHWVLSFSDQPEAEKTPLCTVVLHAQSPRIEYRGVDAPAGKVFDALMVLAGFPAPCDVLPVGSGPDDKSHLLRQSAGGMVFTRQYRVVYVPVGVHEARAEGWINDLSSSHAPLTMVSVLDADDQWVVRQLWPQGAVWWIYEESGSRRSWLLE
jgi:hypothetical protein